ncbi:MAG: hypothetical protein ABI591_17000 [Kofleriaceae bacterium]
MRGFAFLVLVACAASPPPTPEISIVVPPASPPPPPPDHTASNEILAAYGHDHALGVDRRAPTPAELAAALDAESVDPSITPERWREMNAATRMMYAWEAGQHAAWLVVCRADVATWWQRAKALDDAMASELATPAPSDFYAGMAIWQQRAVWWKQQLTPSVLARDEVGAWHRMVVARNAWAAPRAPLEQAIAGAAIIWPGRELEALDREQARMCSSELSLRAWPPPRTREPGTPFRTPQLPQRESGRVTRVRGTEVDVTRRDREITIESVPPCKRVHCTGIDCGMDAGHGWRDVCATKQIKRVHDVAFVLDLDSPPVVLKVGDPVEFFLAPDGHAVLATAPHYALPIY